MKDRKDEDSEKPAPSPQDSSRKGRNRMDKRITVNCCVKLFDELYFVFSACSECSLPNSMCDCDEVG